METLIGKYISSISKATCDEKCKEPPGVRIPVGKALELALRSKKLNQQLARNSKHGNATEAHAVLMEDANVVGNSVVKGKFVTTAEWVKIVGVGSAVTDRRQPQLIMLREGGDDTDALLRHGSGPVSKLGFYKVANEHANIGPDGKAALPTAPELGALSSVIPPAIREARNDARPTSTNVDIILRIADGKGCISYTDANDPDHAIFSCFWTTMPNSLRRAYDTLLNRIPFVANISKDDYFFQTFNFDDLELRVQHGFKIDRRPVHMDGCKKIAWDGLHLVLTASKNLLSHTCRLLFHRYGKTSMERLVRRIVSLFRIHCSVFVENEWAKFCVRRAGRAAAICVDLWWWLFGALGDVVPKDDAVQGPLLLKMLNRIFELFSSTSMTLLTQNMEEFKKGLETYQADSAALNSMLVRLFGPRVLVPVFSYRCDAAPFFMRLALTLGMPYAQFEMGSGEENHQLRTLWLDRGPRSVRLGSNDRDANEKTREASYHSLIRVVTRMYIDFLLRSEVTKGKNTVDKAETADKRRDYLVRTIGRNVFFTAAVRAALVLGRGRAVGVGGEGGEGNEEGEAKEGEVKEGEAKEGEVKEGEAKGTDEEADIEDITNSIYFELAGASDVSPSDEFEMNMGDGDGEWSRGGATEVTEVLPEVLPLVHEGLAAAPAVGGGGNSEEGTAEGAAEEDDEESELVNVARRSVPGCYTRSCPQSISVPLDHVRCGNMQASASERIVLTLHLRFYKKQPPRLVYVVEIIDKDKLKVLNGMGRIQLTHYSQSTFQYSYADGIMHLYLSEPLKEQTATFKGGAGRAGQGTLQDAENIVGLGTAEHPPQVMSFTVEESKRTFFKVQGLDKANTYLGSECRSQRVVRGEGDEGDDQDLNAHPFSAPLLWQPEYAAERRRNQNEWTIPGADRTAQFDATVGALDDIEKWRKDCHAGVPNEGYERYDPQSGESLTLLPAHESKDRFPVYTVKHEDGRTGATRMASTIMGCNGRGVPLRATMHAKLQAFVPAVPLTKAQQTKIDKQKKAAAQAVADQAAASILEAGRAERCAAAERRAAEGGGAGGGSGGAGGGAGSPARGHVSDSAGAEAEAGIVTSGMAAAPKKKKRKRPVPRPHKCPTLGCRSTFSTEDKLAEHVSSKHIRQM